MCKEAINTSSNDIGRNGRGRFEANAPVEGMLNSQLTMLSNLGHGHNRWRYPWARISILILLPPPAVCARCFSNSRPFGSLFLWYGQVCTSQFSRLAIRTGIFAIATNLPRMAAVASLLHLGQFPARLRSSGVHRGPLEIVEDDRCRRRRGCVVKQELSLGLKSILRGQSPLLLSGY
jgi:hypothetical protein